MLATGMAAEAAAGKRRIFALNQFFLKNGTQPARIHEHFSKALLPALNRVHSGPKIFMDALVAPQMPQVAVIIGYPSFDEMQSVQGKLLADKELAAATESWESHAEQPYEHMSVTLLEATDYCPEIAPDSEPRKSSRIFELRTYHSPTWRQLKALHERFAGPEIRIFHRVGVRPILYTSGISGQNLPNLTYVTPFENLAAREKAWDAFGADPEWIQVRKESIERSGQISSVMQISLYRATGYSPIR